MATGLFLTVYERANPGQSPPVRAPRIMRLFRTQIYADTSVSPSGGSMRFLEGLGHACICKVKDVAPTLLQTIAADPEVIRLPVTLLDDPLSSLTNAQKAVARDYLLARGFTLAEIQARFTTGNLGDYTVGDVLRFILKRRLKPRYDQATDSFICDGPEHPTTLIEYLDPDG